MTVSRSEVSNKSSSGVRVTNLGTGYRTTKKDTRVDDIIDPSWKTLILV